MGVAEQNARVGLGRLSAYGIGVTADLLALGHVHGGRHGPLIEGGEQLFCRTDAGRQGNGHLIIRAGGNGKTRQRIGTGPEHLFVHTLYHVVRINRSNPGCIAAALFALGQILDTGFIQVTIQARGVTGQIFLYKFG